MKAPKTKEILIMTLGEKLKNSRKSAGLTQEQLADKLMVSRQAVTKWEADRGIPDIENLKAISQLLNVSVGYLIDDNKKIDTTVIKEAITLSDYGKGQKAKNLIVKEKYPQAEIRMLIAKIKTTKKEHIIGDIIAFFTDAPFGVPQFINDVKNMDKQYYLVNHNNQQFLVMITDEFIESRELNPKITDKKFEIGEWKFTVGVKI